MNSESRPVVLVTGASGFVGRHLVPTLLQGGWSVRRAVRSPEGLPDEVVIGSRTGLEDSDARRRVRNEHVAQPIPAIRAESPDRVGEVHRAPTAGVDVQ